MAVGASKKQPIVINEKIEIAEIMTVTLSVDHRAVDGALGAKFLNAFKHYIENPLVMFIETAVMKNYYLLHPARRLSLNI